MGIPKMTRKLKLIFVFAIIATFALTAYAGGGGRSSGGPGLGSVIFDVDNVGSYTNMMVHTIFTGKGNCQNGGEQNPQSHIAIFDGVILDTTISFSQDTSKSRDFIFTASFDNLDDLCHDGTNTPGWTVNEFDGIVKTSVTYTDVRGVRFDIDFTCVANSDLQFLLDHGYVEPDVNDEIPGTDYIYTAAGCQIIESRVKVGRG